MNNSKEIKKILKNAINIERWAPKSNHTYPFLEEEEIKEMVESILKEIYLKGYKIIKK